MNWVTIEKLAALLKKTRWNLQVAVIIPLGKDYAVAIVKRTPKPRKKKGSP